ncbi:MAG: acylhydrolase [Butyrivibrio sp.]|nr:acylhydrolase [Butyrivibrio sp.]
MKLFRDCPLLVGIGATAIILSILSFALKDTVYADVGGGAEGPDEPALARVFKAASMGIYPWSMEEETQDSLDTEAIPPEEEAEPGEETGKEEPAKDLQQEDTDISGNSSFDISGNSFADDISGNSSEEETYEFTEVDDDYFTDALFIGDSRTVGLSEYCEELDTRATFYAKISLTIYDCMSKEFIKTDDGKINVETALSQQQYGKIYIMLGINEIGTGNAEYFKNAYSEVIDRIRALQPDAIIYIQGIMHVTEAKSSVDKYFNNDNINERNQAIAELADNRNIFYLDMNEVVDDGKGNLDRSLSFDDVHLKASSYERWHEFLLHNGIIR